MKIEIKNRWTAEVIFSAEAESMRVAVELAIKAEINLSGSDLSGSDLSGSDLRNSNLSGSDLRNSNLSYSNLRGSDLSGSNLRGSDLGFTNIPMWCGTLKGVKVDIRLVRQMLLHIFALECEDKTFKTIKRLIKPFAKLSEKWHYYEEKQKGE